MGARRARSGSCGIRTLWIDLAHTETRRRGALRSGVVISAPVQRSSPSTIPIRESWVRHPLLSSRRGRTAWGRARRTTRCNRALAVPRRLRCLRPPRHLFALPSRHPMLGGRRGYPDPPRLRASARAAVRGSRVRRFSLRRQQSAVLRILAGLRVLAVPRVLAVLRILVVPAVRRASTTGTASGGRSLPRPVEHPPIR